GPRRGAASAAEKVFATLPRSAMPAHRAVTAREPHWTSLGLALALGFLLALVVFPPWKSRRAAPDSGAMPRDGLAGMPPAPAPIPALAVARLVLATGAEGVEYDDPARGTWQPVTKVPQFLCPSEGCLRTNENVRCELVTAKGGVVRMNSGTEI